MIMLHIIHSLDIIVMLLGILTYIANHAVFYADLIGDLSVVVAGYKLDSSSNRQRSRSVWSMISQL